MEFYRAMIVAVVARLSPDCQMHSIWGYLMKRRLATIVDACAVFNGCEEALECEGSNSPYCSDGVRDLIAYPQRSEKRRLLVATYSMK